MNSVNAYVICLTFDILFTCFPFSVNSQNLPDRNNFNFVFENLFNDNTTGTYLESEFTKDWNLSGGNKPFGNVEIYHDDAVHQKLLRAYYPTGTINPSPIHGFTWYSYLSSRMEEIYFSYDVRFKPGFQWVLGGKIPGVVGGGVISGQLPTSNSGFSVRLVWKSGGTLLFYVYHHDQKDIYGDIYEFEGFRFETGKWYNLTMRIVLNSMNNGMANADGILEGYVDGKLMFQKTNFRFRLNEKIKIERMYICSFFGGNTKEWAALRDEWIDLDNFIAYTYSDKIRNVPRGLQASALSRRLIHPYLNILDTDWKNSFKRTEITKTSVSLTWNDYPVPVTYTLERKDTEGSTFTTIATLTYDSRAFVDNSLKAGHTYIYRLKAGNSVTEKTFTTLDPLVPHSPTSLRISGLSKSTFVLVGNAQTKITKYIDNVADRSPLTIIGITDIFGKLIFQESVLNPNIQYTCKLDFMEYEPGLYFLQIIS